MPRYEDEEGNEWESAGDIELDNLQLDAIHSPGNLVIDAGPGSGKTEVLAQLVRHRIQTGKVPAPRRILALSYKTDAAKNIKRRVEERMAEPSLRFDSMTLDAWTKGTVDRFRLALPTAWRPPADYNPTGNTPDLFSGQPVDPDDAEHLEAWAELTSGNRPKIGFPMVARLAELAYRMNPMLIHAFRQTYPLVVVDEFQDTTGPQYDLLHKLLKDDSIQALAIGDSNQRIMKWAGALENALQTFETDFNATQTPLRVNYRSLPEIVTLQREMLQWMNRGAGRHPTSQIQGDADIIHRSYGDDEEEALDVARVLSHWSNQGDLKPADLCVLVRNRYDYNLDMLVDTMNQNGLACRFDDTLQVLNAEPLVGILLDLLELTTPGQHAEAWNRQADLIRATRTDFGRESSAQAADALGSLVDKTNSILADHTGQQDQIDAVIENSRRFHRHGTLGILYPQYLDSNLVDFRLTQFRGAFLRMLHRNDGDIAAAISDFRGESTLAILTIHKAKGLEFDGIVLLGIEDRPYRVTGGVVSEDEKNLLLVGVSRARSRLLVTDVRHRNGSDATSTGFERLFEILDAHAPPAAPASEQIDPDQNP